MTDLIVSDIESLRVLEIRSDLTFRTQLRLNKLFIRIERMTISWLNATITSSIGIVHVKSFKLPLAPLIRRQFIKFYKAAYSAGGSAVANSIPGNTMIFTARANNRIVARADLASERFVSRIERDLKQEWSRAIGRKIDQPMLHYRTKVIFAEVKGSILPQGL